MVRWCPPGGKSGWGWSGGAEGRAVHGKPSSSRWPADCLYSSLGCAMFISEKGLNLEERPAAGPVSKTEWYLNPFMQ